MFGAIVMPVLAMRPSVEDALKSQWAREFSAGTSCPDDHYGAKEGLVRLWVVVLVCVLIAPMVLSRVASAAFSRATLEQVQWLDPALRNLLEEQN
jgi:hypothetical protein